MQRSYLVKSPVHFADFGFFVKVGDILVHDTANGNRLTVYRNGEVVRAVKQTPLGIAAMVKNEFIQEVVQAAPRPKPAPKAEPKPKLVPKKITVDPKAEDLDLIALKEEDTPVSTGCAEPAPAAKRGKAQGRQVPAEETPERPEKALELPKIKDETL